MTATTAPTSTPNVTESEVMGAGTDEAPWGARAAATLTVAFSRDPVIRWFWPDGPSYLASYPALLQLLGIDHGGPEIVERSPDGEGAALWWPPGRELDAEAAGGFFTHHLPTARHEVVATLLERMAIHHLDQPHWYLPFIGVDPAHQGAGHGTALLRRGLARADADGLPTYLEASSESNRRLYERHGFEVTATVQVADSPPLWPMVRPAHTAGTGRTRA